GLTSASLSWGALPFALEDDLRFWVAGRPRPATDQELSLAVRYVVEAGYLPTLRIRLLRGRFLEARDDERAAPVVVIDDVFARQQFGQGDPLHQHLRFVYGGQRAGDAEIVGVVGHVRQWRLDGDEAPARGSSPAPPRPQV